MLGVGQIGDGDAVDGVHRDLPIVAAPQAGGDGVGRHRIPKPQGGGNSAAALVIGMVIGQAEHPETGPVERPGTISRRGKAGVGGGGKLVGAEGLLVDPVDVKGAVEGDQIFVAVVETVRGRSHRPGGSLLVDLGMDQVVTGGGKADRLHHRLRFRRLWIGRAGDGAADDRLGRCRLCRPESTQRRAEQQCRAERTQSAPEGQPAVGPAGGRFGSGRPRRMFAHRFLLLRMGAARDASGG